MRLNLVTVSILLGVLAHHQLRAQVPGQDYQALMQAMEKAQVEASKPGDDKLTCEQLEEQLVAVAQDPELQAHVESAGASAQKDQEAIKKGMGGQRAIQSLRTAFMAMMPGGAAVGMASAQAQAQAQGAQAADRVASRMDQAKQMMALLPKLMRGQRVVELAAAKECEWASSAGMNQ
jgi:hypothetical protein